MWEILWKFIQCKIEILRIAVSLTIVDTWIRYSSHPNPVSKDMGWDTFTNRVARAVLERGDGVRFALDGPYGR